MTLTVHQLVHGYRRGHQLLASSIRLNSKSNELTKRLSDLSGLLTRESEFAPYLTTYPLPDDPFHALAKTWPDPNASRAGCVLTHTLLIPTEYWTNERNHLHFADRFTKPEGELADYAKPLTFQSPVHSKSANVDFVSPNAPEFVAKYFGQGLRPIVWFDEIQSEQVFWHILNSLWPSLRRRFACCTFSLQPRQLDNQPFDLLFAPTYVYSRFNKIAQENLIDPSKRSNYSVHDDFEPWIVDFAEYIFTRHKRSSVKEELHELGIFLGEDPTSIRNVFRLEELRRRSEYSPTAAVGAMDVLSSLASSPDSATRYKENLVNLAIESARGGDTSDSLKALFLISERLQQTSYSLVAPLVESKLSSRIAQTVEVSPDLAIETGERVFSRGEQETESIFRKGLIQGLANLCLHGSENLTVLHRYPLPAANILSAMPQIGAGFLRAMRQANRAATAGADLAGWISRINNGQVLRKLRTTLLPEVRSDDEIDLAESLLSNIGKDEVLNALDTLCDILNEVNPGPLQHVITEHLAVEHPTETRRWATKTKCWSASAADLTAASFTRDEKGLSELLTFQIDERRLSQIVTSYIGGLSQPTFPLWFRNYAKNRADFLLPLMRNVGESSTDVVLDELFSQLRDVAIASELALLEPIGELASSKPDSILIDQAMRSAIRAFVAGVIPWNSYITWISAPWINTAFSGLTIWDVEEVLIPLCYDYPSWSRAWALVGHITELPIPKKLDVVPRLVESLVSRRNPNWPWEKHDTAVWTSLLNALSVQSKRTDYLRLCAYALDFAFRNTRFPLSKVVVHSFWPVYTELLRTNAPSSFSNLMFTILSIVDLDWDKAKDLRKKLIKSFITSSWPPGDLALAIDDRDTLRKIFKRLIRYSDGVRYVRSMIADLKTRGDTESFRTAEYLEDLLRAPNFYEAWD
jgi:GTPase-associated protein 1, N-terminal domain type 1